MLSLITRRLIRSRIPELFSTTEYIARKMSENKLQFSEVEGDLFGAPKSCSLAHCVGADMSMDAGVAVKFRDLFGQMDKLISQKATTGKVAVLQDNERYIYYLVTKDRSNEKPTYDTLRSSLSAMKSHMKENNVQKLAIPRLGCGIDGLEWDKVKEELINILGDENIELTVYTFVPK